MLINRQQMITMLLHNVAIDLIKGKNAIITNNIYFSINFRIHRSNTGVYTKKHERI